MSLPTNLKYTEEHEWVLVEGDVAAIGITPYAADKLGDIVYIDLPAVGSSTTAATVMGEIESTKSVGEVYAPVSGEVVEVNESLSDTPELVNADAFGSWLVKLRFTELPTLLDAAAYEKLIAE